MLDFACSAEVPTATWKSPSDEHHVHVAGGVSLRARYLPDCRGGSEKYGNEPKAIYRNFLNRDATLWSTAGTLTISPRFDRQGNRGFVQRGGQGPMQPRTVKIEGTFDMPCRGRMVEGGCEPTKLSGTNEEADHSGIVGLITNALSSASLSPSKRQTSQ